MLLATPNSPFSPFGFCWFCYPSGYHHHPSLHPHHLRERREIGPNFPKNPIPFPLPFVFSPSLFSHELWPFVCHFSDKWAIERDHSSSAGVMIVCVMATDQRGIWVPAHLISLIPLGIGIPHWLLRPFSAIIFIKFPIQFPQILCFRPSESAEMHAPGWLRWLHAQ